MHHAVSLSCQYANVSFCIYVSVHLHFFSVAAKATSLPIGIVVYLVMLGHDC